MQKPMSSVLSRLLVLALVIGAAGTARSQPAGELQQLLNQGPLQIGEGWSGFTDFSFLLHTLLTLILASVLGAIIGYHPKHVAAADTLEELDAPKVYVLYAVIGAIIGILVIQYNLVIGLVIFGIGGLIRFRTQLRSANVTGRVIFVTLIGLACGLDLPHVGVLATAFAFVLVYLIERRVTYRVDINALERVVVAESAAAYRALLEKNGCRVLSERKNLQKERVTLLVSGPPGLQRNQLEELIDSGIEGRLKGAVDWETD
ncbi:MAG TPA: hypothetical protein VMR74_02985 [Gammaproteobacteria bacterium]|nr:hypothetical protein [Gammaproteobacteria bacterium]